MGGAGDNIIPLQSCMIPIRTPFNSTPTVPPVYICALGMDSYGCCHILVLGVVTALVGLDSMCKQLVMGSMRVDPLTVEVESFIVANIL